MLKFINIIFGILLYCQISSALELPALVSFTQALNSENWVKNKSITLKILGKFKKISGMAHAMARAEVLRRELLPVNFALSAKLLKEIKTEDELKKICGERYLDWISKYDSLNNELNNISNLAKKYLVAIGSKPGFSSSKELLNRIIVDVREFEIKLAKMKISLKGILLARSIDQWQIYTGKKYPLVAKHYLEQLEALSKNTHTLKDWRDKKIQSEYIRGVGTVIPKIAKYFDDKKIPEFWHEASLDSWKPKSDEDVKKMWGIILEKIKQTYAVIQSLL